LNHNHDVLALVSGLTLPPLGVACLWLLALSVARIVARHGRLPARRAAAASAMGARAHAASASAPASDAPGESSSTAAPGRSSDKLAA
jgi:hypothetical protein